MRTVYSNRILRRVSAVIVLAALAATAPAQDSQPPANPPPTAAKPGAAPGAGGGALGNGRGALGGGAGALGGGAGALGGGGGMYGMHGMYGALGIAGGPVYIGTTAPKSKLEEMLDKALKNNPDLRVAATKAQEAEAELNRTRLEVTRKVIRVHAALEAAKAGAADAEQRLAEIRKLATNGRISTAEVQAAEKDLATAKTELATAQGEAAYIVGEPPNGVWNITNLYPSKVGVVNIVTGEQLGILRENQPQMVQYRLNMSVCKPPEEMATRIREALGTLVRADYNDVPLSKLLKDFENTHHLTFIERLEGAGVTQVDLHLSDQPLGAVLQAISDQTAVQFVVRDYGILVVGAKQALPADAIHVHEFWKAGAAAVSPKQGSKDAGK
jgi:hypothetical protein